MGGEQLIILDTCAIIWDALDPSALSPKAKAAIAKANKADGMTICSISLWEIAMLIKKGRLDPGTDYQQFISLVLAANNYHLQEINPTIAELATNLPNNINQDPADRIIAATAISTSAPLITADKKLRKTKQLTTIW